MSVAVIIVLGFLAGLHAALYGAYKDSPHESFIARRFVRELIIATTIAAVVAWFDLARGQAALVVFLSVFTLSRIATEFWKLFLRVELQEGFRIPTQIHAVRGPVRSPVLRLLLGLGFLGSIYGCYHLFRFVTPGMPGLLRGIVVGGGFGLVEAVAGAYKDGSIEGFSFRKFLKSPTFGAIGGILAAAQTDNVAFLMLAAYAHSRMFLELLFKILVPEYTPGKFKSLTGPFQVWMDRRRGFLAPYTATWFLYLVLMAYPVVVG